MKEYLIIFCLILFARLSTAQTEIIVADFDSKEVDSLNQRQQERDSIRHSFHLEKLERMKSDDYFIDSPTESDRARRIEHTKIMYRRHAENIAKQHLTFYTNDSIEAETKDKLYSPTICFLQNDSLSITIVNNLFGGFNSELILNQQTFTSSFTMDSYRERVFMNHPTDTMLLSNIQIGMNDAVLKLKRPLNYEHGEEITGLFELTTNDFYRVSDYDPYLVLDTHSTENPDEMRVEGSILFKCRVVDLGLIEEY